MSQVPSLAAINFGISVEIPVFIMNRDFETWDLGYGACVIRDLIFLSRHCLSAVHIFERSREYCHMLILKGTW
jgi:hypothetical protein